MSLFDFTELSALNKISESSFGKIIDGLLKLSGFTIVLTSLVGKPFRFSKPERS